MSIISTSNGSGYTTAAKVRVYAGVSTSEASDSDLATFIVQASRRLSRDITARQMGEELTGTIDGSNTKFRTSFPYIADRNLDAAVDASDVTVRSVTLDASGLPTLATLTVSNVDALSGVITLSSAPATTVDHLQVDYEHYFAPVYLDQLEEATAALVAHMVHLKNKDPGKYTVAQLRGEGVDLGRHDSRWLRVYHDLVQQIRLGSLRGGT